jgi:cytochrome c oxidase subunit 4
MIATHVTPRRTYFLVFAALLLLTATTVAVSAAELGRWHAPVALLIASVKATLVVLFFMHVLHSPRLVWLAVGVAIFCFGILYALSHADYATRNWLGGDTSPQKQLKTEQLPAPQ